MPERPLPRPPDSEDLRYAVVVVNTALGRRVSRSAPDEPDSEDETYLARAFHYLILPGMHITAGQLVWVPFRTRTLQGIVVDLDSRSPVENVRPLLHIADPVPVLDEARLALAHWISQYYLTPLHQVIAAMLPPGVLQPVDTVYRTLELSEEIPMSESQRALYDLLRAEGALPQKKLQRLKPLPNWRNVLDQLLRRGWVERTNEALPPTVQPKMASFIRLLLGEPPQFRKGSQPETAYHYLAKYAGTWVRLEQAAAEAEVSAGAFRSLITREAAETQERQVWRDPLQDQVFLPDRAPELTREQRQVWEAIAADLEQPAGKPFLLQGVTGSGKTEIYLRAVERILEQGRGAIVLVPEIALTPQTIQRFGARFGSTLAVLHSGLSAGERYDQWRLIRAGKLRLVVGARSALFAPLPRLGLVVLDEEHEWTYKQENIPRYHARDAAAELIRASGATCILGSATPSLESAYQAELGAFVKLTLPSRILCSRQRIDAESAQYEHSRNVYHPLEGQPEALAAELPPVQVVDMREELRAGNTLMFSRALQDGLERVLENGQQAILFLNRRGSATFILCRECGYVLSCPRCERPLTYHGSQTSLICHQCGYRRANVSVCPNCQSKKIKYFGAGTERVEEGVCTLYPQARVVRWDLDTTGAKGDHERILEQFVRGQADILVGTQMVAKGLDLPRVTLVGVVSADTMIHLPDLRASERTFQLLTQVAGRAGRSALGGQVIIQTYAPEHPAIQAASRHDVDGFYAQEMRFRREQWYPPLSHLVALRFLNTSAAKTQYQAEQMAEQLRQRRARLGLPELDVIGPAPCYYAVIQGRHRWQILLRGSDPAELVRDLPLPLGWQVDVDPMSLL